MHFINVKYDTNVRIINAKGGGEDYECHSRLERGTFFQVSG